MKPNKLKRNLIIIFTILTIFVSLICVLYSFTDIFRTKRGAFFRYFGQIPELFDILETSTEFKTYQNTKESKPYTRTGEMVITSSSNIADESILSKIKLSLNGKTDNKNEKNDTKIYVKSDDKQLFDMNITREKNLYGFYAPQIADGYITIRNENINKLAENIGIKNANDFPDKINPININKILEVKQTEKNSIMKYAKMIRDQAPDTAYTKQKNQKIEIDGQKYQTTAYTLKLNSEQNASLQIALLEKLTTDSIMMNFITSKCKLINLNQDFTDINTLNTMMKQRIEMLKKNPSDAGEFSITLYESKQKNIQTKIETLEKTITINHIENEDENKIIIKVDNKDNTKITIRMRKKSNGENCIKVQSEEADIVKSIELIYTMSGTVEENNIKNNIKINLIDDIKSINFEYNDKINFTNDIGIINGMQQDKIAIINEYDSNYVKDFIMLVKKQINTVYVNQAASIGINLNPIFQIN